MDNSNKLILDLCGGSGSWSRPYREAGYMVEVITLPEYDVTRVEFGSHAMHFERMDVRYHETTTVIYEDVYGILAAPPCTEFSLAKNGSHRKRDLREGMETIRACMEIIWQCRLHNKLQFWALENPVGYLRQFLGKPQYTFYQWWFGGLGIKRTDLWGYYTQPEQIVFERPEDQYFIKQYKSGKKNQFAWAAPECPEWAREYIDNQADRRAALRAITPAGFAQAFYKANK